MFTIELLPAEYGDCIWIEWGDREQPKRLLIDGGTNNTLKPLLARIERMNGQRRLDLLVVTHIDEDHIGGAVKLLSQPPDSLDIGEIWFNGYRHCRPTGYLGAKQGEFLAVLIEQLEKRKGHQLWNTSFKRDAAMIPDAGPLPTIDYDGLKLTVLGPTQAALNRLGKEWNHVVEEYWTPGDSEAALAALKKDRRYRPGWLGARSVEDLADSEMNEDAAAANGSSIVLLAEYGVHRCLFAADAQPTPLTRALDRLSKKRLFLSVLKVPHHGSERNNSAELYRKIEAEEYLISTNGDRFAHPDDATVARILVNKPARARVVLRFNYASGLKSTWMADEVKERFKYSTEVPTEGNAGLRVIRED